MVIRGGKYSIIDNFKTENLESTIMEMSFCGVLSAFQTSKVADKYL